MREQRGDHEDRFDVFLVEQASAIAVGSRIINDGLQAAIDSLPLAAAV